MNKNSLVPRYQVTVCVVSSSAYTMNRDLQDMLSFSSFAQNAKNLADNVKNTISTQSKAVTDYVNSIDNTLVNTTKTVLNNTGRRFVLNNLYSAIEAFLEDYFPFLKSLFGGSSTLNTYIFKISHFSSLISNLLKNLKNAKDENISAIFLGETTLIVIPDNDPDSTEAKVNKGNWFTDSATSDKTSQLKEAEERADPTTFPVNINNVPM